MFLVFKVWVMFLSCSWQLFVSYLLSSSAAPSHCSVIYSFLAFFILVNIFAFVLVIYCFYCSSLFHKIVYLLSFWTPGVFNSLFYYFFNAILYCFLQLLIFVYVLAGFRPCDTYSSCIIYCFFILFQSTNIVLFTVDISFL